MEEDGEAAKFPRSDDYIPEEQCSSSEAYPSTDAGDSKAQSDSECWCLAPLTRCC